MRIVDARLIHRSAAWAGVQSLVFETQGLGALSPGQPVLVCTIQPTVALLPLPVFPYMHDVAGGILQSLAFEAPSPSPRPFATVTAETPISLLGPIGLGFTVDNRTRRALVLAAHAGLGAMLFLARYLVERGIEVTFLATDAAVAAMPLSFLPSEVEYLAVDPDRGESQLRQILDSVVPWADQLFLAVEEAALPPISDVIRRRLLRMKRGFAQVLFPLEHVPCGVGACNLCVIRTREGYRRRCKEGLVVDVLNVI